MIPGRRWPALPWLTHGWPAGGLAERSRCRGTSNAKAPEWALLGRGGHHQETQEWAGHLDGRKA